LNFKGKSVICEGDDVLIYENLFGKVNQGIKIFKVKKAFWSGIKINEKIAVLTSNRILSNGEDKLIFINIISKIIFSEINGYSFILSKENLAIMPREKNKYNCQMMLCACKKYIKGQKNGILLLKMKIGNDINDIKISEKFYDTKYFEVYCFCPILIWDSSDYNIFDIEKNKIIDTEYFFAGGLDTKKNKGMIRLYKLNHNNKQLNKIKIEYIQDIYFEKSINIKDESASNCFTGIKGPIISMTQSLYNENILATCLDGNVFLLSIPNIEGLKELWK
jgi:hypothetical protein